MSASSPAHRLHANVVGRDELTHTELELERLVSAAARVEHSAVFESADVMHPYTRAVGREKSTSRSCT